MNPVRRLFITDYCLTPYENIPKSGILCKGEKIVAVGGSTAFAREPDLEIIEMEGVYAVPGFVDTHIHGAGDFDATNAGSGEAKLSTMGKVLATHGVTSFVPTVTSAPLNIMLSSISAIADMIDSDNEGAEAVGIHVEGPFLNKEKHGSQRIEDVIDIDMGIANELVAAGKGKIKIFTFAPELRNADKLIELFLQNGIRPSMGHSMASESDVIRAVDAGVTRCTHLYNGMPPLHHRDIALTAVALTDDRISIELILDGELLHPRMVDMACRCKPKDKLIGVSDAVQGLDLRDGRYHIGSANISVKGSHVTTDDGVLAGTTLTLEKGWHHLVTYSHLKDTDAAACFTTNPAKDLGLTNVGEIRPGKLANISFFDAETNKIRLTVCRGRIIYDSNGKYSDK